MTDLDRIAAAVERIAECLEHQRRLGDEDRRRMMEATRTYEAAKDLQRQIDADLPPAPDPTEEMLRLAKKMVGHMIGEDDEGV